MGLTYLSGDPGRPRGHALILFRRASGSDEAFATYAVVLPIVVEPMKYLPPAFAAQFQGMAGALQGLDAVPMPPIPEAMTVTDAQRLAERRGDDLIDAGVTDGAPMGLMNYAQEAVRAYADAYRSAWRGASTAQEDLKPSSLAAPDDDSIRWILMDERARIDEMTRLVGRLRDDLEMDDDRDASSLRNMMGRLAELMAPKYRASELVAGAARPGPAGTRLAQLYLDRCYRLCGEHYEGLADIDREIAQLEGDRLS